MKSAKCRKNLKFRKRNIQKKKSLNYNTKKEAIIRVIRQKSCLISAERNMPRKQIRREEKQLQRFS